MTVFVYVNTSKQVGDPEHMKVFATTDAAGALAIVLAGARVAADCKTLPTKIRPQRGAWAGAVSEMRLLCRETN